MGVRVVINVEYGGGDDVGIPATSCGAACASSGTNVEIRRVQKLGRGVPSEG